MVDEAIIEKRLNKLEKAVDNIQDRLDDRDDADNWLQKLIGSISDEETFVKRRQKFEGRRQKVSLLYMGI